MDDMEHSCLSFRDEVKRTLEYQSVYIHLHEFLICDGIDGFCSYAHDIDMEIFGMFFNVEWSIWSDDEGVTSFDLEIVQSYAECCGSSQAYYCQEGIADFVIVVDLEEVESSRNSAVIIVYGNVHFTEYFRKYNQNVTKVTELVLEMACRGGLSLLNLHCS